MLHWKRSGTNSILLDVSLNVNLCPSWRRHVNVLLQVDSYHTFQQDAPHKDKKSWLFFISTKTWHRRYSTAYNRSVNISYKCKEWICGIYIFKKRVWKEYVVACLKELFRCLTGESVEKTMRRLPHIKFNPLLNCTVRHTDCDSNLLSMGIIII
jgi:hypothetical protein